MSEVLSIRLSPETKAKLDKSAKLAKRSKSFIAAEAIEAYLAEEAWRVKQIQLALDEAETEEGTPHEEVANWLKSWGQKSKKKAPWQK